MKRLQDASGKPPRPKDLILGLLLASASGRLDVSALIRGGEIFGLQGNSIRVTTTRLLAEGLIESPDRGIYMLGRKAQQLAREAARWKHALTRVRDWNGHWLVISTGHLPRSDRTALNARNKALHLGGFRPLQTDVHVRPDNLEDDLSLIKARLGAIGLDDAALLMRAEQFAGLGNDDLKALWDCDDLNRHYRQRSALLERWLQINGADTQKAGNEGTDDQEEACRESWLLGAEAIRSVVYDPLLPAGWIDENARAGFMETVKRFDARGQAIWMACLQQSNNPECGSDG